MKIPKIIVRKIISNLDSFKDNLNIEKEEPSNVPIIEKNYITAHNIYITSPNANFQGVLPANIQIPSATLNIQTSNITTKNTESKEFVRLPSVKFEKLSEKDKIKFFLNLEVNRIQEINLHYPITTIEIDGSKYTFAYAWIHWSDKEKSLIYEVIEPKLPKDVWRSINKTLNILKDSIDIPLEYIKDTSSFKKYILERIDKIWKVYKIKIPKKYQPFAKYYIIRDTIGYGKIDPLMNDPNIEDISCNGVGIPIFIFHRNPYIGEIKTNIVFNSEEELNSFVIKLALRTGRFVSVAQPLLDAALPDGSRVQITYGKDISRRGSSFTIRKFSKDPFTPIDLLNYGTVDYNILAYLWTLIEEGKSILIAGGTATGKTSMLNAISLFIKPEKKIVSIEDTPELRLPHPNWLQEVARPGFGPSKYGEVTLADLLKAALRQRPDYIVVGEVRGKEAYILFQAMATGHAGLGTIHAESFEGLIDRLISPPINLPPVLLEVLDAVVFLRRMRIGNKHIRRVDKIYEIIRWDKNKKDIDRIVSFEWIPPRDEFVSKQSYLMKDIMEFHGWDEKKLESNLLFKMRVLHYLWKKKIRYYKDVAQYIKLYYENPQLLLNMLEQEEK